MTKEIENAIVRTIIVFNLSCDCRCRSFAITNDYYIRCQNCKKVFRLKLKEYESFNKPCKTT